MPDDVKLTVDPKEIFSMELCGFTTNEQSAVIAMLINGHERWIHLSDKRELGDALASLLLTAAVARLMGSPLRSAIVEVQNLQAFCDTISARVETGTEIDGLHGNDPGRPLSFEAVMSMVKGDREEA